MCLMFTPAEPSDTLLVLAPLDGGTNCGKLDAGPQHWQMTYINTAGSKEVLMVVPVPNAHGMGEQDFVLSAVFPDRVRDLRAASDRAFKAYAPPKQLQQALSASAGFGGSPFGGSPQLAVQTVGAYDISVAPTLADLEHRAPWSRFTSAAGRVDAILADMRKSYPTNFAFIIAQASQPVKEAGFSVVYRDTNPFVPTAHEVTAAAPVGLVKMDATILAFNTVLLPHSVGTAAHLAPPTEETIESYPTYRVDDCTIHTLGPRWESVVALLRALPVRGAGEFHRHKILRHAKPTMVCRWKLNGDHRNANVVGRPATASDVAAMTETLEQLDAFVTLRTEVGESSLVAGVTTAVPELTLETAAPRVLGFAFGQPEARASGNFASAVAAAAGSSFDHRKHAHDVLGRHGATIDFVLVLVGRQLAYPGIADRRSDALPPPSAFSPGSSLPQSEMFLNLDVAGLKSMNSAIDLDAAAFARKDSPEFCTLSAPAGASLVGTVYCRIAPTPAPHYQPAELRTVRGTAVAPPAVAAAPVAHSPFAPVTTTAVPPPRPTFVTAPAAPAPQGRDGWHPPGCFGGAGGHF